VSNQSCALCNSIFALHTLEREFCHAVQNSSHVVGDFVGGSSARPDVERDIAYKYPSKMSPPVVRMPATIKPAI